MPLYTVSVNTLLASLQQYFLCYRNPNHLVLFLEIKLLMNSALCPLAVTSADHTLLHQSEVKKRLLCMSQ